MKEKFLPIGTVVLLKEATKKLMITGYCSAQPEEPNKVFDYVGMLFPEGNLMGDDVALFNHDQINSIEHMGLDNDEFKSLDKTMKEALEEEKQAMKSLPVLTDIQPLGGVDKPKEVKAEEAPVATLTPLSTEPVMTPINQPQVSSLGTDNTSKPVSAATTSSGNVVATQPVQQAAMMPTIDFNALAPFTPENINIILNQIRSQGDALMPISEPTAFNEENIKKPAFEKPTLDGPKIKGDNKKEEIEEEEEEDIDIDEEEEVEEKEIVADGQPVLQLELISSDGTAPSGDSTPSAPASSGIPGLSRL